MLGEIINEFINHETQYPEFDIDTMVLEHYQLKPGLCNYYERYCADKGIGKII